MSSLLEVQLTNRITAYGMKLVRLGAEQLAETANKKSTTPEDTGRLKAGLSSPGVSGGTVISTTISSTAKNAGFDYPAFIDKVPYIKPTRAKFLHFFYRGQEVFSKGFANRHMGWWAKAINQAEWSKALSKAKSRAGRW